MKTPKRILERRRSVRIHESFLFKIGGESYETQGISVNLSSHGILGMVEKDIPLMTQLKIALQLPTQGSRGTVKLTTIHIKGVIVRKDKDPRTGRFLIAIYFSNIKADDQKRLQRFISGYLKNP